MNVLNPEFQTDLLKVILQDHAFISTNRSIISIDLFNDETEKVLILYILKFYDKYTSVPSFNSLINFMTSENYDAEEIIDIIKPYYKDVVKNISFIEESICDFVKRSRLKNAILQCSNLLGEGNYDQIYKNIKDVVFSDLGDDVGSFFWDNKQQVLTSMDSKEQNIPTGIHDIDDEMSGGAARGTLNVIITPPNKGKTTLLINIGKYAALEGFKVIHYTFELSSKVIERRYFQSMVRMTKKELKNKKRTAYGKLLEYAGEIISESLLIKRFPANTCTCGNIRRHLNLVKNKYGYIPDAIIFDYADLIKPDKDYDQKRFEVESIYYDLRNIAEEYNSAAWTASQTNRSGAKEKLIGMEDLDECYKKAAAADVILSINQNLDEKRSRPQTARVFFAKNRDDKSEITVEIRTDWSKAWVGNL